MNVFISWSGPRSKAVAEVLTAWLKCVIQSVKPWISTQDLDSGTIWFNEINDQLKTTSIGIICITQENKNNPWILFETGALAKGLENGRIYTFLIDLEEKDLTPPLSQFNHTFPLNFESMKKLVASLNRLAMTAALDAQTLEKVFSIYWNQFQLEFKQALEDHKPGKKVDKRSGDDILDEILINVRSVAQRVALLEMNQTIAMESSKNQVSLSSLAGFGRHNNIEISDETNEKARLSTAYSRSNAVRKLEEAVRRSKEDPEKS